MKTDPTRSRVPFRLTHKNKHVDKQHYQNVREAFLRVRDLEDPALSEALIDLRSREPGVHGEVLALLAVDSKSISTRQDTLERAILAGLEDSAKGLAMPDAPKPGDRVGPYTIDGVLGDGGFGTVYAARQDEPVRLRVALKVIKAGMDTRQVIARFEQERQALAILDHPNIAKVLGAGATTSGKPYFAMELVEGEPIDRFCQSNNIALADRLALFCQVCSAVQHAHTKGLIHRDLKPGNVLVATRDGEPHAKVIDFGIAKAIAAPLTDRTLVTELRQFMGTPQYMSPEQAEGSLDIDTRTDVYALGALLYQLITGVPPFADGLAASTDPDELRRLIRETDPPKPSTRLAGLGEDGRTPATRKLTTRVRGELDWIVLKAMEKDRRRRYETPSALAADLQRFLAGDAVHAAPPSRSYRLSKFVRKNRAAVTTVTAVMVTLLVGVVAFAWQAQLAQQQRDLAEERQREAEAARLAEAMAREEADAVADFQSQQLSTIDIASMGIDLRRNMFDRRRSLLERTGMDATGVDAEAARLEAALEGVNFTDVTRNMVNKHIFEDALDAIKSKPNLTPRIQSVLLQSLSLAFSNAGLHERALQIQAINSEIYAKFGVNDQEMHLSIVSQDAVVNRNSGNITVAGGQFRHAMSMSFDLHGPEHEATLAAMNNYGMFLYEQGQYAQATEILESTLETQRRVLPEGHRDIFITLTNLAAVRAAQEQHVPAEQLYREAYEGLLDTLGEQNRDTLTALNGLASMVYQLQGPAEAIPYFRQLLVIYQQLVGDDHPDTYTLQNNLGFILTQNAEQVEADELLTSALDGMRTSLGNAHPGTLTAASNLGVLYFYLKRYDESEPLLIEVLKGRRLVLGQAHPETIEVLSSLGSLYRIQNRFDEAVTYWSEAWNAPGAERVADSTWLQLGFNLGWLLMELRKYQDAEPVAIEFARLANSTPEHPTAAVESADLLVRLYTRWHAAEPDAGHGAKAAQWQVKLDEAKAQVSPTDAG